MKASLFFLALLVSGSLLPSSASAQCVTQVAPLECLSGGMKLSDLGSGDTRWLKLLPRKEPRFELQTFTASPSQAPFASDETAPWESVDFWQPRMKIRAQWTFYQDPSPAGIRISLGYVRGSRVPWLPKDRGAVGLVVRLPVPGLDSFQ